MSPQSISLPLVSPTPALKSGLPRLVTSTVMARLWLTSRSMAILSFKHTEIYCRWLSTWLFNLETRALKLEDVGLISGCSYWKVDSWHDHSQEPTIGHLGSCLVSDWSVLEPPPIMSCGRSYKKHRIKSWRQRSWTLFLSWDFTCSYSIDSLSWLVNSSIKHKYLVKC